MTEHTKNMLIAVALSLLFVAGWDYFIAFPSLDKQRQNVAEQQRIAKLQNPTGAPGAAAPRPVTKLPREAAIGASARVAIDTRSISGSIALKGARLDDVSLKLYHETVDDRSPIIVLLSPEEAPAPYFADAGFLSTESDGLLLPGPETVWTADSERLTIERPLTLTYDNGQGLIFTRRISIDSDYLFTLDDSVENKTDKPVSLHNFARVTRIGKPQGSGYAALHEGFVGVIGEEGLQELNYDKIEKEPNAAKTFKGAGGWVGFTDKYWGAVVAPDQARNFEARYASTGALVKTYEATTITDAVNIEPGKTVGTVLHIFSGAKVVDTLDAYSVKPGLKRFDLLIDWGWFYFITRRMFTLIDILFKVLGNFGLAILAVTVVVKLIFLPLANRSYQSIAKMKAIQPRIKELKEKHGDDKHAFNLAQMELFKQEKVSPLGGCLPMLLQIPVFFSLYKVLIVTIEMRHAPFFGWIKDLSAPDPTNLFNLFGLIPYDPTHIPGFGPYLWLGVWPLIMGFTMWLQMKMNPEPTDEIQKMAFSWMPVMFTFTMGSFASGLVIYWSWNNFLSIIQQWVIMTRAGVKFELWDNLRNTFRRK